MSYLQFDCSTTPAIIKISRVFLVVAPIQQTHEVCSPPKITGPNWRASLIHNNKTSMMVRLKRNKHKRPNKRSSHCLSCSTQTRRKKVIFICRFAKANLSFSDQINMKRMHLLLKGWWLRWWPTCRYSLIKSTFAMKMTQHIQGYLSFCPFPLCSPPPNNPLLIMIVLAQNPFVYGMTLESLYAQSTDFGWNPTFLTETNQPLVHKVSACQRDTFVE